MNQVKNLEEHLRRLNAIGIALSSERDLGSLLDRILHEARAFTHAQAGSLYVVEGDFLRFVGMTLARSAFVTRSFKSRKS